MVGKSSQVDNRNVRCMKAFGMDRGSGENEDQWRINTIKCSHLKLKKIANCFVGRGLLL